MQEGYSLYPAGTVAADPAQRMEINSLYADNIDVWSGYWANARRFHLGLDGTPKNIRAALINYRKASRLGCGYAFYPLGFIFEHGDHVQQDARKAKFMYESGIETEIYVCHLGLARLSARERNFTAARNSMVRFFRDRYQLYSAELESLLTPMIDLALLISYDRWMLDPCPIDVCHALHSEANEISAMLERWRRNATVIGDLRCAHYYAEAQKWISSISGPDVPTSIDPVH